GLAPFLRWCLSLLLASSTLGFMLWATCDRHTSLRIRRAGMLALVLLLACSCQKGENRTASEKSASEGELTESPSSPSSDAAAIENQMQAQAAKVAGASQDADPFVGNL